MTSPFKEIATQLSLIFQLATATLDATQKEKQIRHKPAELRDKPSS